MNPIIYNEKNPDQLDRDFIQYALLSTKQKSIESISIRNRIHLFIIRVIKRATKNPHASV